jgi:SAM-dependent methyltransferase
MNFPHKLRKLFDPEIIGSMREHIHRAFHPVSARRLQRKLEMDPSWEELRRKYPRGIKEVHRFGDTNFWIKRNVERSQDLSLDRGQRRHILDLGCGPGFFLYVAEKLGHTGVGLDIDEQAIFRDTLRLLKVGAWCIAFNRASTCLRRKKNSILSPVISLASTASNVCVTEIGVPGRRRNGNSYR